MDPSPDSDRSSRRTRAIVLTVIGAGVGLIAYNAFKPSAAEETRNVYKNREDCIAATGDATKCEPSQGRGGYPHTSYFGPLFFPGAFGSNTYGAPGTPGGPSPGVQPTPARPVQPIGEYRSQRGGFGGSSSGYSSGT